MHLKHKITSTNRNFTKLFIFFKYKPTTVSQCTITTISMTGKELELNGYGAYLIRR